MNESDDTINYRSKTISTKGAVGMSVKQWCEREGLDPLNEIDIVCGMTRLWQTSDISKNLNKVINKPPRKPDFARTISLSVGKVN